MTVLFKRAARIVIDTIEVSVDPNEPGSSLDVRFAIERSLKPEPNTAEIQVWNLNEDHRAALEELDKVPVTVEAGYEKATALLFSGTIRNVFTVREGADLVTTLSSGDGEKEYQQKRINVSIAKGTPNDSALKQVIKELGLGEGNLASVTAIIAAAPPLFPQGGVLSGSASQIMQRIIQSLGFEWSIQEGTVQLLRRNDTLTATAVSLTPSTGLVGSPSVDNEGILSAKCLMIPDIFPGRLIVLDSERLSGNFRAERCQYSGDTAGSDWYIDVEAGKV